MSMSATGDSNLIDYSFLKDIHHNLVNNNSFDQGHHRNTNTTTASSAAASKHMSIPPSQYRHNKNIAHNNDIHALIPRSAPASLTSLMGGELRPSPRNLAPLSHKHSFSYLQPLPSSQSSSQVNIHPNKHSSHALTEHVSIRSTSADPVLSPLRRPGSNNRMIDTNKKGHNYEDKASPREQPIRSTSRHLLPTLDRSASTTTSSTNNTRKLGPISTTPTTTTYNTTNNTNQKRENESTGSSANSSGGSNSGSGGSTGTSGQWKCLKNKCGYMNTNPIFCDSCATKRGVTGCRDIHSSIPLT